MVTQKRLVQVTLDLMCYEDLDIENMNWKDLLELEGDEDVHASIKEFDPFWNSLLMRTGCTFIRTQHYTKVLLILMDSFIRITAYL